MRKVMIDVALFIPCLVFYMIYLVCHESEEWFLELDTDNIDKYKLVKEPTPTMSPKEWFEFFYSN